MTDDPTPRPTPRPPPKTWRISFKSGGQLCYSLISDEPYEAGVLAVAERMKATMEWLDMDIVIEEMGKSAEKG